MFNLESALTFLFQAQVIQSALSRLETQVMVKLHRNTTVSAHRHLGLFVMLGMLEMKMQGIATIMTGINRPICFFAPLN